MKSFEIFTTESKVYKQYQGYVNKSQEHGYNAHKKGLMAAPSKDAEFSKHMGNVLKIVSHGNHDGSPHKVGHPDTEHYEVVKQSIHAWHKGWEKADSEQ
jgi:hypothetical protein